MNSTEIAMHTMRQTREDVAGRPMDQDLIKSLASLEFAAEMGEGEDTRNAAQFRRLLCEAGYKIPAGFNPYAHLSDDSCGTY